MRYDAMSQDNPNPTSRQRSAFCFKGHDVREELGIYTAENADSMLRRNI